MKLTSAVCKYSTTIDLGVHVNIVVIEDDTQCQYTYVLNNSSCSVLFVQHDPYNTQHCVYVKSASA